MTRSPALAVAFGLACIIGPGLYSQRAGRAPLVPSKIYVAEFVSRTVADKAILSSLTDLFQRGLVDAQLYRPLNRRTWQQLTGPNALQPYIASMADLDSATKAQLARVEQGEGAVFGEVREGMAGEVTITVTLEDWSGVKYWTRSVVMKRALLADPTSRYELVQRLIALVSHPESSVRRLG